jgi:hypothetical protein
MMTKSIFNKATPETSIMTLDTSTDATVYVTPGNYAIEFEISILNPDARSDENVAITHSEIERLYSICKKNDIPSTTEQITLSPVTNFYVQQDTAFSDPEYVIEDSATDINICISRSGLEQLLILYRMCTEDEHSVVYS